MNKMEEVKLCLKNELIDIAFFSELWSATEDYVAFNGCYTYIKPRMTPDKITVTHVGGVGIIFRPFIKTRVPNFNNKPSKHGFKVLWLRYRPKRLPKEVASLV